MEGILKLESKSVSYSDRRVTSTCSKGNQTKWKKGSTWIKADNFGYEGLSESVSSYIISRSNITNYVEYLCEEVYETDTDLKFRCCTSEDFLLADDTLITLERLFKLNEIDINSPKIYCMSTVDKLQYIIDKTVEFTLIQDFGEWLGKLLEFDALVLNEDRHFNNIAVINNNGVYRLTPVFDNGAAFMSDTTREYPLKLSTQPLIKAVHSKPFSTSFNEQLEAVKQVCGLRLKISNSISNTIETEIYSKEEVTRVEEILNIQIEKYKYLFV